MKLIDHNFEDLNRQLPTKIKLDKIDRSGNLNIPINLVQWFPKFVYHWNHQEFL